MTDFTWLATFGLAGVAAGFVLQRSRLCFVSALRDLFLFRATGMTRSILLLLLAASLGGFLVAAVRTAMPVLVGPASLTATLAGGGLFGFGMVLAGSCAATALWRTGEGQLSQLPILLGIFLGTNAYAAMPLFSEVTALAASSRWAQVTIVAMLLGTLLWWERRSPALGEEIASPRRTDWWRQPWSADAGALSLAGLNLLFIAFTGRIWRVTAAFVPHDDTALALVAGLALGGFFGARWGREWRIRPMGSWPERILRLSGGLLMGYGARLASGCTIGLLLSGSVVAAWTILWWLAAAVGGAWLGSLVLHRSIVRMLRP